MKLLLWTSQDKQRASIYVNDLFAGPQKDTKAWFQKDHGQSKGYRFIVKGDITPLASTEAELEALILKKARLKPNAHWDEVQDYAHNTKPNTKKGPNKRGNQSKKAIALNSDRDVKDLQQKMLQLIPGIGAGVSYNLILQFGSIKGISRASKDELLAISGVREDNIEGLIKTICR